MQKRFRFVLTFIAVTGFLLASQLIVESAFAEVYTFTFKNKNLPPIDSVYAELRVTTGDGYAPMGKAAAVDLNIPPGQSYTLTINYNPATNVLFSPPNFVNITVGCATIPWNNVRGLTKNFYLEGSKSMTIDVSLSGNTFILEAH
jgi:hypothetical protein